MTAGRFQTRSRCSSSATGRFRQNASIMARTCSAIATAAMPAPFVTTIPRATISGARLSSAPAEADWIQRSAGLDATSSGGKRQP